MMSHDAQADHDVTLTDLMPGIGGGQLSSDLAREGSRLPAEILIMILDYISLKSEDIKAEEHKYTLSTLCLVSRIFCAECQPRLFQTLLFSRRLHDLERMETRRRYVAEAADPKATRLARLVQEVTYSEWPDHDDRPRARLSAQRPYMDFVGHLTAAAERFCNLTTVALEGCLLTTAVFAAFAAMRCVHTVAFRHCSAYSHLCPGIDSVRPRNTNRWTNFTVFNLFGDFGPSYLAILRRFIDLEQLRFYSSQDWELNRALFEKSSAPSLQELDTIVPPHCFDYLRTILQHTPNIRKLRLTGCPFHSFEPLAPHVIPRLESLECMCYSDAHAFLPHRAISSLNVTGFVGLDDGEYDDVWVAQWTGGIRELTIPITYLHVVRPEHLPHLHTLTVRPDSFETPPDTISFPGVDDFNPGGPGPLPALTTIVHQVHTVPACLYCAKAIVRLRAQRTELVARFAAACPNATRICVGDVVEWRRTDDGRDWCPRVLSSEKLRGAFSFLGLDVQDVDENLLAVIQDDELPLVFRTSLGLDSVVSQEL